MLTNIQPLLVQIPLASTQLLQFADDTILFTPAHVQNLTTIRTMLDCFSTISGLQVNYHKSGILPIAVPQDLHHQILTIMGCQQLSLPFTYLGLPLSNKKPSKHHYLPLLRNIQERISGWKGKLLSLAGRATLVNSVVNALPLHYMQAFLLPKWVIKEIVKATRRFLWRGHDNFSGGHCLASWGTVCLPKELGGLGILDISTQNISLLLKWLWSFCANTESLWPSYLRSFPNISSIHHLRNNSTHFSFFVKDLLSLLPTFTSSISFTLGNGQDIAFWLDTWFRQKPLTAIFPSAFQDHSDQTITVSQAIPILHQILPLPNQFSLPEHREQLTTLLELRQTSFSFERDRPCWNWSTQQKFSCKSAYDFLIHPGILPHPHLLRIWTARVPPKVRIFGWLLLRNKLLTAQNLRKRGWPHNSTCSLCQGELEEDVSHTFTTCQFTRRFWSSFAPDLHRQFCQHDSVLACWSQVRARHDLSQALAGWWALWKERNSRIFRNVAVPTEVLVNRAHREFSSWAF